MPRSLSPNHIRPLPISFTKILKSSFECFDQSSCVLTKVECSRFYHIPQSRNMAPKGPYRLCTVSTAPERAKGLIGRVVEDVKEEYTIHNLQNMESG